MHAVGTMCCHRIYLDCHNGSITGMLSGVRLFVWHCGLQLQEEATSSGGGFSPKTVVFTPPNPGLISAHKGV